VIRAAYRQVFERDIVGAYSQVVSSGWKATQVPRASCRCVSFIPQPGAARQYRRQVLRTLLQQVGLWTLAFRHFLGRGGQPSLRSSALLSAIVVRGRGMGPAWWIP